MNKKFGLIWCPLTCWYIVLLFCFLSYSFYSTKNQHNYINVIIVLFDYFQMPYCSKQHQNLVTHLICLFLCVLSTYRNDNNKMDKNIPYGFSKVKALPRNYESKNHNISVELKLTSSPFPTPLLTLFFDIFKYIVLIMLLQLSQFFLLFIPLLPALHPQPTASPLLVHVHESYI